VFSSRTSWNFSANDLTKKKAELFQNGRAILDLTETNPTKSGFSFPFTEILSSLSHSENIFYSPNPKGNLQARETICNYYTARNISVSPEQIILTSSSSEAYSLLFRLLCNVGDEVLIPKPSYPLFEYLAEINDVQTKYYHLEYDGSWKIDVENIKENISEKTKAIILVNPNNPTGSFVSNEEREKIFSIAYQKSISIIEDEVFADFRFQILARSAGGLDFRLHKPPSSNHKPLTFLLNGISKTLALPQMKLGWIVIDGDDELQREAIARLEILADTFLSVNTPIQNALPELLLFRKEIQEQILLRIKSNYDLLQRIMFNSQCSILNGEGGWSGIIQIPKIVSDEQFAIKLLQQENVFVHPGHFFDFEKDGYIIVSLLPQKEIFEEGIMRLKKFVEENFN